MIDIRSFNPDVLSCLANLSNDEVFTPPKLANEILDLLPQSLWSDKTAKFLDPCAKTGVFLREIAKRLLKGLEKEIPGLHTRINHIFKNQIYGLSITELTAHLTRRSVYCSKHAAGKYSVCDVFDDDSGNICFERIEHTWKDGKCVFCGANQESYDRGGELETHAYQFIHTETPEEIFNMKFDVIVGNPPYQLSDGGGMGSSALPIYHKFIQQAKKMTPRYLVMVVPSRWFTGGRGLDEFRDEMLHDDRIRIIHDFLNASDCFPGVEIKGGVCYFLWDKENIGNCHILTHKGSIIISETKRPLLEESCSTFIRYNEAIPIFRKVRARNKKSFSSIISANDPFGFDVRVENSYKRVKPVFKREKFPGCVEFYYFGWRKDGIGYIDKNHITKNTAWVNKYKVFIPKAWGIGNMTEDWLTPFMGSQNSCCTETYLLIGPFDKMKEAENIVTYTQTKFFHFMLGMVKITQNTMKGAYQFVPMQDFSEPWTNEKLYKKYGLTQDEIAFIESMIRPMEAEGK
ncbi:MAG: Eco57I restriction-modification methylase domain-containing protein [Treponema sp.]|nr:Eco57I restriction-modification methylase domain-containing protein [Treponema sp.]